MKKNTILFIIFILLLGGFFIGRWYQEKKVEKATNVVLFDHSFDDIDSFQVTAHDEVNDFSHGDDGWKLNEKHVKEEFVNAALQAIVATKVIRTASRNLDSLADYGLKEDAPKIFIRLKDGNDFQVVLGDMAQSTDTQFVRIKGIDEVKVIDRHLSTYFVRSADTWIDEPQADSEESAE